MRSARRLSVAALALVAACESASEPGVPPVGQPPPGAGPGCGGMCAPPPPTGEPGDPIEFLSIGVDNFGGFFEPVEVQTWGDRIAMCTGVRGLAIYRAEAPCCVSLEATIIPDRTRNYPRCQHFTFIGDRVFITNQGDEILPETFVSAVDVSDPLDARTEGTHVGPAGVSYQGIAGREGVLYVAQHESGLAVFSIADGGAPRLEAELAEGFDNAWQPLLDPGGAFLYVADAAAGLVVLDVSEPFAPRHVATVPSQGTLKDLARVGDIIYGAAGSAGVEVFDVSDPMAPVRVTRADTPGSALGIAAEPGHLVVADWNDVQLFSLEDPRQPVLRGHQKAYTGRREPRPDALGRVLDVALKDGLLYMAEWAAPQVHRVVPEVDAPDAFTTRTIEMLRTPIGETRSVGAFLQNLGRTPLTIEDINVDPPFEVSISGREVAPGRSQLIDIQITPDTSGPARGEVRILTNDPDEPDLRIDVLVNQPGLRVGDEVPDLVFTDLEGNERSLRELRGRPVLLAYFATF